MHGTLPTVAELKNYKAKLKALRGLPAVVLQSLELLPAAAHPMDVLRTGCSALGSALPEKDDHNLPGARAIESNGWRMRSDTGSHGYVAFAISSALSKGDVRITHFTGRIAAT